MASRPDVSSLSVVCLEVGCGLTVPTVRRELEKVVQRFPGGRLIRVNPENPGLAKELVEKGVSLPLPAAAAIEKLSQQVAQTEEIMQATYVLWGQEGGCEIRAPFGTCLGRLLRLVETQGRMTVEFKPDVVGIVKQAMGPRTEPLTLERSVPMDMYQEVKVGDGAKLEVTAIIRVMAKFSGGSSSVGGFSLNAPLAMRVDQVCKLLDEVNHAFSQPEYQKAAEGCEDRRSLLKETRNIQFEVLPKYGIEATEKGTSIMAAWISSAQNGIKDVDDKVAASMHLSRIAYASKLPLAKNKAKEAVPTPAQTPQTQSVAVERAPFPEKKASAPPGKPPPAAPPKATPLGVATPPVAFGSPPWQPAVEKEEKPVEKKEPPKPKPKPKEEKPPQALTVTLTRFSTWEDPTPQRFQVELMSNTKVSELRAKIAELCALDDSETRKVKLIKRKKAGFVTAQETESVSSEVFVHQIEKWPK